MEERPDHRHRVHQCIDGSSAEDRTDSAGDTLDIDWAVPRRVRLGGVHRDDLRTTDDQLSPVTVLVTPGVLGDDIVDLVDHGAPVGWHGLGLPSLRMFRAFKSVAG